MFKTRHPDNSCQTARAERKNHIVHQLAYLPAHLRHNKKIVLTACHADGVAYRQCSSQLKEDADVVIATFRAGPDWVVNARNMMNALRHIRDVRTIKYRTSCDKNLLIREIFRLAHHVQ